jgi:hypothetical protein
MTVVLLSIALAVSVAANALGVWYVLRTQAYIEATMLVLDAMKGKEK